MRRRCCCGGRVEVLRSGLRRGTCCMGSCEQLLERPSQRLRLLKVSTPMARIILEGLSDLERQ